eukprot:gb/GEZN01007994.1/.p1 GENE.gb/GEZN01007994.1/~~gb/GEZN01007994.1/.p1  ORF type:complete len:267 (+),score=-0.02 gb/GEZN01007994.1/:101-901(+)
MSSLDKVSSIPPSSIRRSEPMQVSHSAFSSRGGRRTSTHSTGEHRIQPYSRKKPRPRPKPTVEPPLFFLPASYEEPSGISLAAASQSCPNMSEVLSFAHGRHSLIEREQDRDDLDSPPSPEDSSTPPSGSMGFSNNSPTIFSLLRQNIRDGTQGHVSPSPPKGSSVDSGDSLPRPFRSVKTSRIQMHNRAHHDEALADTLNSLSEQLREISFSSQCHSPQPRSSSSSIQGLRHAHAWSGSTSSDEDLQFEIEFSSGSSPPKTFHIT